MKRAEHRDDDSDRIKTSCATFVLLPDYYDKVFSCTLPVSSAYLLHGMKYFGVEVHGNNALNVPEKTENERQSFRETGVLSAVINCVFPCH